MENQDVQQLETILASQKDRIHSGILSAANEFGEIVTDDLKHRLAEPYPPASTENTDPHKRTGLLQEGSYYFLDEDLYGLTLYVVSSRESRPGVPFWLEKGNSRIEPRNYMARLLEDWNDKASETVEELFYKAFA